MVDHAFASAGRRAAPWTLVYLVAAATGLYGSTALLEALSLQRLLSPALQAALFIALSGLFVHVAVIVSLRRSARSEQRCQGLIEAIADVAWMTDPLGRQALYVNPAAERIFGRTRTELLGLQPPWLPWLHGDDLPAVQARWRMVGSGNAGDIEYRIVRSDGQVRWLRERTALLSDAQGRPVSVACMAEDITDRRIEIERHREQAMRLESLLNCASDAIISVDLSQRVCLFNRTACAVFRISAEAALGQPLDNFIPPARQLAHRLHVDTFVRNGSSSRRMGRMHGLAGVRSNGEVFPIEASISRSGTGEAMLLTVVLRDVTAARQAESARQALLRAEGASRAKSEFVARMSHEMRTPLNAVLGFSQLMQSDEHEPLAPVQQRRVERIRAAGWHLLQLIADVMDLASFESGSVRVEATRVALFDTLDEAIAICETQARSRDVGLHVHDREGRRLFVQGDPIRLRQVLINVLSNAIKYNRAGGAVDIHAGLSDGRITLEVQDSGIGMTPEQLEHLYEPFNRLGRERGEVEGSGIGLVLTRQLVERMNGLLRIDSEPGRGTRVFITLVAASPGSLANPSATPAAPAAALPGDAGADLPPAVVLYIEDNPVNVLLVEQLLTRWPQIRFVHADDGQGGIELARRLLPDLVLLDMQLPDMHGTAVLSALRADPDTAALGVVALSASDLPEDAAIAREAGAIEYWTKPIDVASFHKDLVRVLAPEAPRGAGR
jgi:PAS domain S-box-containing protein